MTGKNVVWLIVYYAVLVAIVYLLSQDAPLSAVLYYRVHRTARVVARVAGRINLAAENRYHELTRIA